MSSKVLTFYWKFSGRVFKAAFYVSNGTCLAKNFFGKKIFFSSIPDIESQNSWTCVENFSSRLLKLHSRCPKAKLQEKQFSWKIFFTVFGNWATTFCACCWNFYAGRCRNCNLMIFRNNLGEQPSEWKLLLFKSFFGVERKYVCLWAKISQRSCQDFVLRFRRNTFKEKNAFRKKLLFLIVFGQWANKLWHFTESFPAVFSKLLSTCPLEHV